MTEKEFRRLVTDLEITQEERKNLTNLVDKISDVVLKSSLNGTKIIEIKKAGSWAKGTMLNDSEEVDLELIVSTSNKKPFVLENEALLNSITNSCIYEVDEITKLSDIIRNNQRNMLTIKVNNYKVNLLVRYLEGEYLSLNTDKQIQFTEIANRDYTYFRNAIKIIKYYKESQNINISGYVLEILLYYSLNEYFKDNRYEDYLNAFIRGIDDFIKGKVIQVSKDVYQKLDIEQPIITKKNYMILDVANPNNNLVEGITELQISEYRKLKKALSKLVDNKNAVVSGSTQVVVLNINPTPIKDSDEFAWSYKIENSEYSNNGGSYKNTPDQQLTAMYKALYKGLRAIVDNNLNKKNVEVVCNKNNILKITEFTIEENRSRIKNIEAYIENNGIVLHFK